MKKLYAFLLLALSFPAVAQIPPGYYNSATGLSGTPLRSALHLVIDNHNSQTYPLWSHFPATDAYGSTKVWDIYSDIPGQTPPYLYTFGTDQCGNYTAEGDCFNHEHSWPSSYFNDAFPMRSDLFHLYPTDGWVNNKRANYAYGEVASPTYTSQNGSKLGPNTYPGYTGTVFEPVDSFKGDLARSYFYMATRYYTEDGAWNDWSMANKAELKQWAINMLLEWHHNDPVSQKEIDRNNTIYGIQNNRNPFIDHPEYADCIWGICGTASVNAMGGLSRGIIYPNPVVNNIAVDLAQFSPSETIVIDVLDLNGRVLYHTEKMAKEKVGISVADWAKGIYLLQLRSSGSVLNERVVVQ